MLRQLFRITAVTIILFVSNISSSNIIVQANSLFAQERPSVEELKKLGVPEDELEAWYCCYDAGHILTAAKTDTDYDKAIEKYKEIIKMGPTFSDFCYEEIGRAYMEKSFLYKGKKRKVLQNKAEEYWKEAITLNSERAKNIERYKAYYAFIHPDKEKQRREEAERYYRKGSVIGGLAMLENDEAKYKEAIENLEKAIEIDLTYEKPYIELGRIYYTKRVYPEAEKSYKKAIRINPGSIEAHYCLANYYYWRGQPEKAKKEYQRVLKLDPNHKKAKENLKKIESTK
jgi:tetratricopeptide (TPR) repeat protein